MIFWGAEGRKISIDPIILIQMAVYTLLEVRGTKISYKSIIRLYFAK